MKRTLKKWLLPICIIGGICLITALMPTARQTTQGDKNMMRNERIMLLFDEYGRVTQLTNLQTGHNWLTAADCGYEITVNLASGDIWEAARMEKVVLRPQDAEQTISIENTADGQTMHIHGEHTVNDGLVLVDQSITMKKDASMVTWTMEIDNRTTNAAVITASPVRLAGLRDGQQPMNLLWPDKEGKLYTAVLTEKSNAAASLTASYPSPMSMQYLMLYNDTESLYFGVHGVTREYKDFSFEARDGAGTIRCVQWPFVGAQSKKQLATVHIGLLGGGWYEGADDYREYLIENGFTKKNAEIARTFTGIASCCLVRYSNHDQVSYVSDSVALKDMASVSAANQASYDTPLTIFIGWHEKGFDSRYPDYAFLEEYGGEEAFRQGVEKVHAAGGKVIAYLNLHIAETMSDWYNTKNDRGNANGLSCAIQTPAGSVLHENYGTGLDYVAMCPMAGDWQQAIVSAAERLRRNGADGLWLDQMMEMPGNLCYNKSHGHTTPATAYAEGYDSLMAKVDAVMRAYGEDYFYCCEGTCDAYINYIDLCGLMWARPPGADAATAQQITRYSMPTKFFGLPTAGTSLGAQAQYADAWVQADGMLCRDENPLISRFSKLANRYPDIYFDGRYLDQKGLRGLPDGVSGAVCVSAEGGRAAIQLFNHNDSSASFSLNLEGKELGLGECANMLDAESGEMLVKTEDGWLITVRPGRADAVIAEFMRP